MDFYFLLVNTVVACLACTFAPALWMSLFNVGFWSQITLGVTLVIGIYVVSHTRAYEEGLHTKNRISPLKIIIWLLYTTSFAALLITTCISEYKGLIAPTRWLLFVTSFTHIIIPGFIAGRWIYKTGKDVQ